MVVGCSALRGCARALSSSAFKPIPVLIARGLAEIVGIMGWTWVEVGGTLVSSKAFKWQSVAMCFKTVDEFVPELF